MAGSKAGGRKTAKTNKGKYGEDYYKNIGHLGGSVKSPNKGFGSNRALAVEAGRKGGSISRRGKKASWLRRKLKSRV